ncbi:hypothetical protein NQ318_023425 [Aromia moschata]|uniref:Uncharacterized protein n=1 Tax=Aromia moschata TaxID=1265417 RepID=A0AAV8YV99_9CUCU|nr:hypothetical protein NQ318_023425 [Aromia moschata]
MRSPEGLGLDFSVAEQIHLHGLSTDEENAHVNIGLLARQNVGALQTEKIVGELLNLEAITAELEYHDMDGAFLFPKILQMNVNTRLNELSGRIDGVEQQIDQVGIKVNRIEKVVEENKEEIERKLERKLEDTRRQVQKEIMEKINGLEPQLLRTSIADSGDCSTSPATPLQHSSLIHTERSVHKMIKPPMYDGQSSWSMYRRQFEAAAKANGWTPQEMATSLVISFRGQALEILQSIMKSSKTIITGLQKPYK